MHDFFVYLIKVSLCLLAFHAFYYLFLRKSTFFELNRAYLVFGIFASFIIPLLQFSWIQVSANIPFEYFISDSAEPEVYFQTPVHQTLLIQPFDLITLAYLGGCLFLFFRLLFSIHKLLRAKNNAEILKNGRLKIIKSSFSQPCSFFNWIFLPKNGAHQLVIAHEIAHIRQFHSIDLVLAELCSLLLWFNPFVVLYKRSLKLQHEFLADDSVLMHKQSAESYLLCLFKQAETTAFGGLAHHFYSKSIKKRIHMMTKNKTKNSYLLIYSLVLPLIAILLMAFTNINKPGTSLVNSIDFKPSIYPVEASKISKVNGYGERVNPISKKKDFHYGIDLALSKGENVLATAQGVVVEATFDHEQKKGNYIVLKHNEEYSTFYSHLNSILVKKGDPIEKGQKIGTIGNTGVSTGPHLHYEVIKNGERVNPEEYLPKY